MIRSCLSLFSLEPQPLCGMDVLLCSNFCPFSLSQFGRRAHHLLMGNLNCLSDLCRVFYWRHTYGGYSGDISPELTLELLKGKENVVLVDVRPEASDCKFF